jgi:hypothetical protein
MHNAVGANCPIYDHKRDSSSQHGCSSLPCPGLPISRSVNDVEYHDLSAIHVDFVHNDVWVLNQLARAGVQAGTTHAGEFRRC